MVADVIGQLARLDKSAGPEGKAYTEPPRPGPGVLGWGLPPQGLDREDAGTCAGAVCRATDRALGLFSDPLHPPSAGTPQDGGRGPEGQDLFPQRSQT